MMVKEEEDELLGVLGCKLGKVVGYGGGCFEARAVRHVGSYVARHQRMRTNGTG
ncbi:unnamed protein product [Brassica rapa subsp. narinosa]|uniref:(rape) hypothetical protein n=1 Tax=Brassica napus TaxID=3708 RepID=A0A816SGT5_BRANA|nr:unnamed protein product [Brassica napus]